jgi:hypothetical protein
MLFHWLPVAIGSGQGMLQPELAQVLIACCCALLLVYHFKYSRLCIVVQVLQQCISSILLINRLWRAGGALPDAVQAIRDAVPQFIRSWNELADAVNRTADTTKAHAFAFHVTQDVTSYGCSLATSQGSLFQLECACQCVGDGC